MATTKVPGSLLADDLILGGTGSVQVPGGTTGQRPGTPVEGMVRKDTTTNQLDYYDGTSWVDLTAGAAGGETNTASNLGAGVGVFEGKVGVDLTFRSLVAIANEVSIVEDVGNDEIDIGIADNPIFPGTGSSTISGGTTAQRPGSPLEGMLRQDTTTNQLDYYDGTSWVDLTAGAAGGEVNTASNLGAGVGVFEAKVSLDLQFRSIVGVTGEATVTEDVGNDEIDIGIADDAQMPGTEGIRVAGGTTAERPGTPVEGDLRRDTTTNQLDYYDGTSWINLTAAAGGVTASSTTTFTNKTLADFSNTVIADNTHIEIWNDTGVTLVIGKAVYISGFNVPNSLPTVALADSDAAATMPAVGLIKANVADAAAGAVLVSGDIPGLDTSAFSVADELYVSGTAGDLTATRPTAVTTIVQKMGTVIRSHASLGIIDISGAGRSNDEPNAHPDNRFNITDNVDATKVATFQVSGITTATTRTFTFPDANGVLQLGVIGTDLQAQGAVLDDFNTLGAAASDGQIIVATGAGAFAYESGATARTSLGVTIGTDVQAFGAILNDFNTLGAAASDGQFIVATGAGAFAYESGAAVRTSLGLTIGTDVQAEDAVLTDLAALSAVADNEVIVGTGAGVYAHESGATLRTSLGLAIGTDVEAVDADILRADTADVLTAGFAHTVHDAGTKTTGTFTPDEADGNIQKAVNGGAHTLGVPANDCSILIQYTNNASAGAITTTAYTKVTGDTITTTDGDDFLFYINVVELFEHLHVQALQ